MIELTLRYGLEFMAWNTDMLDSAPEYDRENFYRVRSFQVITELIEKVIKMSAASNGVAIEASAA